MVVWIFVLRRKKVEKLDGKSMDIVAEKIKKLKEIFLMCLTHFQHISLKSL